MTTASSRFLSVAEALQRVLKDAAPLSAETIDLADAEARILAAPLQARLTQPPFDASAMDGYALRQEDIEEPGTKLRVIGEAGAGHPFDGELRPGDAVRIFTGAPLPAGANAIIIQEQTSRQNAEPHDQVTIDDITVDAGHIRARGFDFQEGDELLPGNRKIGARELSLIAAMGHGDVAVRRRPKVAILSTGDELVPPGQLPGQGQIISSNQLGVAALIRMAGGEPQYLGIARDTEVSLNAHMDRADDADVLVTIGGASVGDHDLVAPVLRKRGLELDFWKIAMRPGKPLMFGTLGSQRVLGLPGNPVSSLVCARVFLVPLIRSLLGVPHGDATTLQLPLSSAIKPNGPRQHYMRACVLPLGDGARTVTPVDSQDSSLLSTFAIADCFIIRQPGAPALPAGAEVDVLPLDF